MSEATVRAANKTLIFKKKTLLPLQLVQPILIYPFKATWNIFFDMLIIVFYPNPNLNIIFYISFRPVTQLSHLKLAALPII